MKKKIRREFILVALFTITLTTLLVTAVFYEFFKKEVMDELDIDYYLQCYEQRNVRCCRKQEFSKRQT